MKRKTYLDTDEYKKTVDENAAIIKECFTPQKSKKRFYLDKELMIHIRQVIGFPKNLVWCSRMSIKPAMKKIGFCGINKQFSIKFSNNVDYIAELEQTTPFSTSVINIILSLMTTDLIFCARCQKVHFYTVDNKLNHSSDFMDEK